MLNGVGMRAYVCAEAVDMRKSIDGLSAMVEPVFAADPFSGHWFVFLSKSRAKVKILYWDRHGFALWYKRLERDKFHWPRRADEAVVTLTGEQLNWLLDGYDVWRMKPHEALHFSVFS